MSRTFNNHRRTALYLLAAGASSCLPAFGQATLFSIDFHGPTIGTPDSAFGTPITEGDVLSANPMLGPVPTPGIAYAGGVGPTLHHLGLGFYPAAVGHPPGLMGFVEVDALSLGVDPLVTADSFLQQGAVAFSVDEFAGGVLGNALVPEVASESLVGDSSADVFTNLSPIPLPNPAPPLFQGLHTGLFDGDGLASGSGYRYRGLGLIEPNAPQGPPPNLGDNLDALEIEHTDWSALFFSLDSLYVDPHPLMVGTINSGSAFAHGFIGSDVLYTLPNGAGPFLYAPAAALGLGMIGDDPDHDDLDALVLRDNGNLTFEAPQFPDQWVNGAVDMIFFSVRRGSTVIGAPDSLRGLPIEEGDILMPPVSPAFGGLSPFPAIYVPAEMLGLATLRSGTASPAAPALGFADDLNALDIRELTGPQLFAAEYCHCDPTAPAPCANFDSLAGCANSTGVGAHLVASGSSSVAIDDLVLTASQVPAGVFGLTFMGPAQIGLPFVDGLRCVGAIPGGIGTFRYPISNAGPAGAMVLGPGIVAHTTANFALNGGAIGAGQSWNFQTWYRDVAGPCLNGSNLSNAVVVTFVP